MAERPAAPNVPQDSALADERRSAALAYERLREPLPPATLRADARTLAISYSTRLRRRRRTVILLDFYIAIAAAVVTQLSQVRTPETSFLGALFPIVWIALVGTEGGYDPELDRRTDRHVSARIRASFVGAALYSPILLWAGVGAAGLYNLSAFPLAACSSIFMLFLARAAFRRRDYITAGRRILVLGTAKTAPSLANELFRWEQTDSIVGVVALAQGAPTDATPLADSGLMFATLDQVYDVARSLAADEIVVGSDVSATDVRAIRLQAERLGDVDVWLSTSLTGLSPNRTALRVTGRNGRAVVSEAKPGLLGVQRLIKSAFDRVSAFLLLIFTAPLLLAIALLVRLSPGAGGPAIFRQERVGKNGRSFVIYKFRTMYVDAEERLAELLRHDEFDGGLFKIRDDPRVTPVGRWLRRLSLDELPQLVNVVKGDMSLVGPRPPLPREVATYPPDMLRRLVVKPGLTGLWQVSGRSDLSWEDSIRLDLLYVDNWSLTTDLVILMRTLLAVFRPTGSY